MASEEFDYRPPEILDGSLRACHSYPNDSGEIVVVISFKTKGGKGEEKKVDSGQSELEAMAKVLQKTYGLKEFSIFLNTFDSRTISITASSNRISQDFTGVSRNYYLQSLLEVANQAACYFAGLTS